MLYFIKICYIVVKMLSKLSAVWGKGSTESSALMTFNQRKLSHIWTFLVFYFENIYGKEVLPFPTCRRILTHLQLTTFGNIVAKGKSAHDEEFLLIPQCFQLCSIISYLLREIFIILNQMLFKGVCCNFVVCEKVSILEIRWYMNLILIELTLSHIQQICSRRL